MRPATTLLGASMRPATTLLVVLLLVASASAATCLPYPASSAPTTRLFAVAETGRSAAELMALDSLAGLLARTEPRLFRVATAGWAADASDPPSHWLHGLTAAGRATANSSLVSAPLAAIVAAFAGEAQATSFVQCNPTDASASAAWTFAAAAEGTLVAADAATVAALTSAGLAQAHDLRGKTVAGVLAMGVGGAGSGTVLASLSTRVFVFQDPKKSVYLGDYAVFARAATMEFGSDAASQKALLERTQPGDLGAALGWGPENTYVSTCNAHGVYVHASDYNKNLAALSNVRPAAAAASTSAPTAPTSAPAVAASTAGAAVHTVSFVMTDGDNLQWTLGPWSLDAKWYGSGDRGKVPVGWTFSPSVAALAPSALDLVLKARTANDELVAGPSGVGYM